MSQFEYRLRRRPSDCSQPMRLSSSQPISAIPMQRVRGTPRLWLINRGARFWKSFVGDTMLAAVLVEMVARMMMIIDVTTQNGLSILPISVMGSEIVSPTIWEEDAVSTTPSPANSTIVTGSPMICPTIWLFCDFANRLKSGIFSDKVAQKPTIAVRPARKYLANEESGGRLPGRASSSATDACGHAHTSRPTPTSSSSGAAMTSRYFTDSEPRSTTQTFATQKMKKPITSPMPPSWAQLSDIAASIRCTAMPPNKVWMPNQPQATSARISAGTFEPMMPNDERSITGNGMPNFVPPKALSVSGISTMTLAMNTAHSASPTESPK